jgi:hypothetical protein
MIKLVYYEMDELISNTIRNVEKIGDDDEFLICMLARDVYLNDIIYVDCCRICCKNFKKGEGLWKEYKELQWYDMNMPGDLTRKIAKLTTLIQSICEKLLCSYPSLADKDKNKTVLALMRLNLKITSEKYDCDKIITHSKKLYRVKSCPCKDH